MSLMRAARIPLTLCLIAILFFGLVSIILMSFLAICPYPVDYVEGVILLDSKLFVDGEGLYRDPSSPPYVMTTYTPLYYLLLACLVKIFGVSFVPGKILTLFITCLVIVTIYKIILLVTGNRYLALPFAIIFLIQPETLIWGVVVRVDILALLFSLLALFYYLKNPSGLPVVSLFLLLSYFTKQSFFTVFAAILFHLLIQGKKREAIKLLGFYLIPLLFIVLILHLATGGHYTFCTFSYHCIAGLDPAEAWINTSNFIQSHIALIFLGVISAVFLLLSKKYSLGNDGVFITVYFIWSIFQAAGIIRRGASVNQFLELNASMSILIASFLSLSFNETFSAAIREKLNERIFAFLLFLLLAVQIFWIQGRLYLYPMSISIVDSVIRGELPPSVANIIACDREVVKALRTFQEPIWCENVGLLLLADKKILMGEPFGYSILPAHLWDRSGLLELFRRRKFSVVLLGARDSSDISVRLAPDLRAGLEKNYHLSQTIGPYYFYLPNPE